MVGLVEITMGIVIIAFAGAFRLPRVIKWMENEIDARNPQTVLRRVHWLEGVVDAHYRITRKWLPLIAAPLLLFVGLLMIVAGIEEIFN